MKRFFLFCSGVNLSVLEQCETEESKFVGIGATIFGTAVLAGLSGGYALFSVFKSLWAAVPFGFLWGCVIFNLDRVIVSGMRKQQRFWLDLLYASPRFVVAVLLGIVISRPLELKLFEREIRAQIEQTNNEAYNRTVQTVNSGFGDITTLETRNTQLRQELAAKQREQDQLYREWIQEAEGTGGTMRAGKGPVFAEKALRLDEVKGQLADVERRNNPLIAQNDAEIARLRSQRQAQIQRTSAVQRDADGFLAQLEALGQLAARSSTMHFASVFITALFIALETAPVLVKLLSTLGGLRPYDQKLEELEQLVITASQERRKIFTHKLEVARQKEISDFNDVVNTEMTLSTDKNRQFLDEELRANQELLRQISEAQTEIAERVVDAWKERELESVQRNLGKFVS